MREVWTFNYALGSGLLLLGLLGVAVLPRPALGRLLARLQGPAQSRAVAPLVGLSGAGLTVLLLASPQLSVLFWIGLGLLPLYLELRRPEDPQAKSEASPSASPKRQLRRLQLVLGLHLVLWTILIGAFALLAGVDLLLHASLLILLALGSGREARRWCFAILNAASLLFVAAAGFEFALSPWLLPEVAPTRYPYPYRMHGFAPNASADENRLRVTTDSQGLRTPQEVPPKPKGELRILVLGGSTMLGDGSPDDKTPSAFLERSLNRRLEEHPLAGIDRVRVVNAGQGWYVTTQELTFLSTQLLILEPDLLLAVDGYNDAHHAYVWNTKPGINSITSWRYTPEQVLAEIYSRPSWGKAAQTLLAASAIREALGIQPYDLVQAPARHWPVADPNVRDLPHEEVRALTQHRLLMNWTLMAALLEACGARASFALQPVIYFKTPKTEYEQSFLDRSTTRTYAPRMREEWSLLEARIAQEKDALGLTVFDSERHLRTSPEEIFTDYCHLTPRGNELLAEAMQEAVVAELQHWPWTAHYRGVRYAAEVGDPLWRAGPPMESWVRGIPRED